MTLALDHPDSVGGLVLASGYYFPTARADGILAAPATLPLLGDLLRHTISPLIGRVKAPGIFRKMFAPQPVPPQFIAEFPTGLTLRPSQMKASSEETALMVPTAAELEGRYHEVESASVHHGWRRRRDRRSRPSVGPPSRRHPTKRAYACCLGSGTCCITSRPLRWCARSMRWLSAWNPVHSVV